MFLYLGVAIATWFLQSITVTLSFQGGQPIDFDNSAIFPECKNLFEDFHNMIFLQIYKKEINS